MEALPVHGAGRLSRCLLLLLLLASSSTGAQPSCKDDVCVEVFEKASRIEWRADNQQFFDVVLRLSLKQSENLRAHAGQSWTVAVPPRSQALLASVEIPEPNLPNDYPFEWEIVTRGNPDARPDPTVHYWLPFDGATPRLLLQGVDGSFSHQGAYRYSFDFQMPTGTLVRAARPGMVVRILDVYTEGGPDPKLVDRANLVTLRHADGTFGDYVHLRQGGVLVHLGDSVVAGQPIARSGNTGFTSQPHLHFMVWRSTWDGKFESVPIRFEDGTPQGYVPLQDFSYSQQP